MHNFFESLAKLFVEHVVNDGIEPRICISAQIVSKNNADNGTTTLFN